MTLKKHEKARCRQADRVTETERLSDYNMIVSNLTVDILTVDLQAVNKLAINYLNVE